MNQEKLDSPTLKEIIRLLYWKAEIPVFREGTYRQVNKETTSKKEL